MGEIEREVNKANAKLIGRARVAFEKEPHEWEGDDEASLAFLAGVQFVPVGVDPEHPNVVAMGTAVPVHVNKLDGVVIVTSEVGSTRKVVTIRKREPEKQEESQVPTLNPDVPTPSQDWAGFCRLGSSDVDCGRCATYGLTEASMRAMGSAAASVWPITPGLPPTLRSAPAFSAVFRIRGLYANEDGSVGRVELTNVGCSADLTADLEIDGLAVNLGTLLVGRANQKYRVTIEPLGD